MNRAIVCGLVLFAATSSASDMGFKILSNDSDPLQYWVDNRIASPGGMAIADVRDAAKAAFNTWQDVACASTAFKYMGLAKNNASITDPEDPYDAYSVTANW